MRGNSGHLFNEAESEAGEQLSGPVWSAPLITLSYTSLSLWACNSNPGKSEGKLREGGMRG